jgi:hypothetical protein
MYTTHRDSARTIRAASLSGLLILVVFALVPRRATAECPTPPTALVEASLSEGGQNVTVAMDSCGRFVAAWQQTQSLRANYTDMMVSQFDETGAEVAAAIETNKGDK